MSQPTESQVAAEEALTALVKEFACDYPNYENLAPWEQAWALRGVIEGTNKANEGLHRLTAKLQKQLGLDVHDVVEIGRELHSDTIRDLERQIDRLKGMITDIFWMARRYASGRKTHTPSTVNGCLNVLRGMGMKIQPDPTLVQDGNSSDTWLDEAGHA